MRRLLAPVLLVLLAACGGEQAPQDLPPPEVGVIEARAVNLPLTREIGGRMYVLESPIHADVALIKAERGDRWGNLVFRKTARNFSPLMCMAARVTIVEAEHIVPVGDLDPDSIHVPSVYVKRVVQSVGLNKWIERRTVRKQA